MAYAAINAKTYAQLVSQSGADIPTIWSKMVLGRSRRKDVFKQLAGRLESRRAVIENYEPGKGKNDIVRFRLETGVGMPPVVGAATRIGKQGQIQFGGFEVKLDWKHGSVSMNRKEANLMDVEFDGKAMEVLGDWFGILKQDEAMHSFKAKSTPVNTIYANNRISVNALKTGDTLTTSLVDTGKLVLEGNGAQSVLTSKDANGNDVNQYLFLATHVALAQLSESNNWVAAQLNAAPRSNDNILFTGGFMPWNGSVILRHQLVDEPLCPVGSPMAPKAYLSEAITAGGGALTIKGGRNARGLALDPQPWWFSSFENFDWPFAEGQAATVFSTDRYVLIYNLAGTDAGKVGMYKYVTGNNGSTIAVTQRLGASITGIAHTTVGNVTWEAGVWTGYHTATHDAGALILQCNSYGVPYGWTLGMGQEALFRCHGDPTMQPQKESQELGMIQARGIDSVWGQSAYENIDGNPTNHVICYHSLVIPGVRLPVVS